MNYFIRVCIIFFSVNSRVDRFFPSPLVALSSSALQVWSHWGILLWERFDSRGLLPLRIGSLLRCPRGQRAGIQCYWLQRKTLPGDNPSNTRLNTLRYVMGLYCTGRSRESPKLIVLYLYRYTIHPRFLVMHEWQVPQTFLLHYLFLHLLVVWIAFLAGFLQDG